MRAQKNTGTTAPALVRMMFCEVDDGFGFGAFWEHESGVDAAADMVIVDRAK